MEGDIFPYTQVRWLSLRKWEILLLDFCSWFIQALTSLPYLLWLYPCPTHTLQVHFSLQVYFHGLFRDSREFNLWSALLGPRNCSGVLSLFFLKFLIGSSFLSHSLISDAQCLFNHSNSECNEYVFHKEVSYF